MCYMPLEFNMCVNKLIGASKSKYFQNKSWQKLKFIKFKVQFSYVAILWYDNILG